MSNITKELELSKKQTSIKIEQDDAVKQVLLLENNESMEDLRIANALGRNHNIARAQTELGKKLEMEKLDNMYAGNVFTSQQIKDLAAKYNLRFLRSEHYCGNLDVIAISKLKSFSKETNVEITDGNLKYNFFMLAPEDCFILDKVVKMKKDPDPALFYKIDEDKYRLIHQWGRDFNIFNRFSGWKHANRGNFFIYTLCIAALLVTALSYSLVHFNLSNNKWTFIFTTVAVIIASIICHVLAYERQINPNENFHEDKWNQKIR